MIRSINRRFLNEETEGWNIRVKTFGGAKVEDMDYYLEPRHILTYVLVGYLPH